MTDHLNRVPAQGWGAAGKGERPGTGGEAAAVRALLSKTNLDSLNRDQTVCTPPMKAENMDTAEGSPVFTPEDGGEPGSPCKGGAQ